MTENVREAIVDSVDCCREAVRCVREFLVGLCSIDGRVDTVRLDENQVAAYEMALGAAEVRLLESMVAAWNSGAIGPATAVVIADYYVRSIQSRFAGRSAAWGVNPDIFARSGFTALATAAASNEVSQTCLVETESLNGYNTLPADIAMLMTEFARFSRERIEPESANIHRGDLDVPESILGGIRDLGAFGMSVPTRYGGVSDGQEAYLAMVTATEQLSMGSLAAGGSLLTRPEILTRALLSGGTEEQRQRWLPGIASGELIVAVAATEPDAGSDVANIQTVAQRTGSGWSITGTKTWCTFAGRADLIMLLARTSRTDRPHEGLSLFVVEKEPLAGRRFELKQALGGNLTGEAISTIGYRGMHSFELRFDRWIVDGDSIVGGEDGLGRGFQLQMEGFTAGRLQTAARAVGVMEAAFLAARRYAHQRQAFGASLLNYPLISHYLAEMVACTVGNRLFTYDVASQFETEDASLLAAMVKATSGQAASRVTSQAVQIHGGYGYAEEYSVSRYFVDARVLSIFEGTEEILALRVIARDLINRAILE